MTASLILAVGRRRAVSSIISTRRNAPAVVRSLQSASAATASSSGSFETNKEISRGMRFSAALTAAAAVAAGGMMWGNNEKADCTAIAAVVGKDDFNARCVSILYDKYCRRLSRCARAYSLTFQLLSVSTLHHMQGLSLGWLGED